MSWRATSSPVIDFATNIRRQTCCLICQSSSTYLSTTTIASQMCVPLKVTATDFPSVAHLIFCTSLSRMKGINCLNLDESHRECMLLEDTSESVNLRKWNPSFQKSCYYLYSVNSCTYRQFLTYRGVVIFEGGGGGGGGGDGDIYIVFLYC